MALTVKPRVFKKTGKKRCGKGFSREELKKAGLSLTEALRFGVPIDSRRRSVHEDNVDAIKALLENVKTKSEVKRKSKS